MANLYLNILKDRQFCYVKVYKENFVRKEIYASNANFSSELIKP